MQGPVAKKRPTSEVGRFTEVGHFGQKYISNVQGGLEVGRFAQVGRFAVHELQAETVSKI